MSEYKYYIKKIFRLAPDQVIIEAGDKSGRPVFNYKPGQYAMIFYRNRRVHYFVYARFIIKPLNR